MKKVIVGISGGVDSSVAALLLKKEGYEVIGVTLKLASDVPGKSESVAKEINDAKKVCDTLNIQHIVLDFNDVFKEKVIDYFANEYMNGRTPNPCVACNKFVKFKCLIDYATSHDIDYVATGHYCKIEKNDETGRYYFKMAESIEKDQTYMLYTLTQDQLSKLIMPLGKYSKDEVRKIAQENNLVTARKKDSQEICFINDNDYIKFIKENYGYNPEEGRFIDKQGNTVGKHKGIINYTIGQRKGLGITFGKPVYVTRINSKKNTVTLGNIEDLYSEYLLCNEVNFMPFEDIKDEYECKVKVRYASKPVDAVITKHAENIYKVTFKEKQKSVTKGQAVVFYEGDILVGGGTII